MGSTVRRVMALIVALGTAFAAMADSGRSEVELLLELLVRKGVVTREEAEALRAEMDALRRGERPPAEAAATAQPPAPAAATGTAPAPGAGGRPRGLRLGMLAYLSYQDGSLWSPEAGRNVDVSRFRIKRGYLDVRFRAAPSLEVRVTPDVHQEVGGDWKLRMKYLYGKFRWSGGGILADPYVEVGMVHIPWLDFEEHINQYRMQDTMFLERSGLFNSADLGLTFGANLGPELPEAYRRTVSSHYAGRYGSFQVGLYGGSGYHAPDRNDNLVLEGRLTVRPFPDAAPGFQLSTFGVLGKGNTAAEPDWNLAAAMLSWESPRLVLTAQAVTGTGNQSGSAVGPDGRSLDHEGYSLFGELRLGRERTWSVIGRWDRFDPDTGDRVTGSETRRWIAGVAWRPLAGATWLLDYQRVDRGLGGVPDEHRLQLTLQLAY